MTIRSSVLGAAALVLVTAPAYAQTAPLATCPNANEVQASVQQFYTNLHKGQFRIKGASGFQFSAMRFGTIVEKQMERGQLAQRTCPVRVSYTYVVNAENGTQTPRNFGEDTTHYFYKNGFGDWVFRHSQN